MHGFALVVILTMGADYCDVTDVVVAIPAIITLQGEPGTQVPFIVK